MQTEENFQVGLLIFPKMTQLDMTGPYEVLNRMPGAVVHLVAKTLEPQVSEHGLPIAPTVTIKTCPQLDLLVVPGGFGVNDLVIDDETIDFVRRAAAAARYVGSVCTGALVLGAAGLLQGKRATTHWMSMEMLPLFGATPVQERVVVDGNLLTGGGVTAGIDFALSMVGEIAGREVAEAIQLALEYDPGPPFDAGSPEKAGAAAVTALRAQWEPYQVERRRRAHQAAEALTSRGR